jgi:flagellar motor switch protein FliM
MPLLRSSEGVTPYDFRRPTWISAERRTVLESVHQRLSAAMEHALSALLRTPTGVTPLPAEQRTFADWRGDLPRPCVAYLSTLEEGGALEAAWLIDPTLARRMVDRQLGGRDEVPATIPPLSALEQTVLGLAVRELWRVTAPGYRDVARLTPGEPRFEDTPASLRFLGEYDRAVLIDFAVHFGAEATPPVPGLTLCLPARRLDAFRQGLPPDTPPTPAVESANVRAILETHLRAARVPLVACLSGFQIAARDGARLAPGDLLETTLAFEGAVELHAAGRRLFLASLGRQHGHVGLRLHEPLRTPPAPPRLLRRTAAS